MFAGWHVLTKSKIHWWLFKRYDRKLLLSIKLSPEGIKRFLRGTVSGKNVPVLIRPLSEVPSILESLGLMDNDS
jgi:hypothetical protein